MSFVENSAASDRKIGLTEVSAEIELPQEEVENSYRVSTMLQSGPTRCDSWPRTVRPAAHPTNWRRR